MNTWIYGKLSGLRTAGYGTYPVKAKQSASLPYVVWKRISTVPAETKDGASVVDEQRWQFEIYAATLATCETIGTALRAALDNQTDPNNSVMRCHFDSDIQVDWGDIGDAYAIIHDYIIFETR